MSVILDLRAVDEVQERTVTVTAGDREQLLVRWLGEILYLYDGLRFVGREFRVTRFTGTELSAVVRGEGFDPLRHPTTLDVKAVTYHQISIIEAPGRTTLRVFLDI